MSKSLNKALFLDRDGVINIEKNYLYKIDDFEFIDGIIDLCEYYHNLGYLIVVVTNQSGIARKYYTENDFFKLTEWMEKEFLKHSIKISKVYHCPHHPSISGDCNCRKPKPGMLIQAQNDLNIDMHLSLLIGDKERDIESAINAGILESYLFDIKKTTKESKATKIVDSLYKVWK